VALGDLLGQLGKLGVALSQRLGAGAYLLGEQQLAARRRPQPGGGLELVFEKENPYTRSTANAVSRGFYDPPPAAQGTLVGQPNWCSSNHNSAHATTRARNDTISIIV
jgi:hypothetical protein